MLECHLGVDDLKVVRGAIMGAAGSQVNVQKLSLCPRNLLTPLSQGKLRLVSVLGYVCVCGGVASSKISATIL